MSGKLIWNSVHIRDLEAAFESWPGDLYEKGRLRAFLLRVRIEAVVSSLPASVVSTVGSSDRAARRLLMSIGEPNLDAKDQARRWVVVKEAIAAYEEICDLLHGGDPHPYPPLPELATWSRIVEALELEFAQV
jgi:hypothetical protein